MQARVVQRGAALVLVAIAIGAHAAESESLVVPVVGFESDTFGFECEVAKGVDATCVLQDIASARDGSKGVGITVRSPAPEDPADVVLRSGTIDLEAGKTYTFTFWGFCQKPPASVQAVVEDAAGKEAASKEVNLIADWVQRAIVVKPTSTGEYTLAIKGMGVGIRLPVGTSVKYSFDDFAVHNGEVEAEKYNLRPIEEKPGGGAKLLLPSAPTVNEDGELILDGPIKPISGALVIESGGSSSGDSSSSGSSKSGSSGSTSSTGSFSSNSDFTPGIGVISANDLSDSSSSSSSSSSASVGNSGGSRSAIAKNAPVDTTGAVSGDKPIKADFEEADSDGGFTVWVDEASAEATVNKNSGYAAYQGIYGLSVRVDDKGKNNYDIQIKSPDLVMEDGGSYFMTFWAWAPTPAEVQVDLLNKDGYMYVDGIEIELSKDWEQFQLGPITPSEDGVYFYAINMGEAKRNTTFYFDNFELSGSHSSSSSSSSSASGSGGSSLLVSVISDDSAEESTGGNSSSSMQTSGSSNDSAAVSTGEGSVKLASGNTDSAAGSTGLGESQNNTSSDTASGKAANAPPPPPPSLSVATTVVSLAPTNAGRRLL